MRSFRDLEFACALSLALLALPARAAAELPAAVVEGAKKEGEVVLYGAIAGQATRPIRELFEKTYGIRVSTWRGDSEEILNRLAKTKGSETTFDVAAGNDAAMLSLAAKGVLDTFEPPEARKFPKHLMPPQRGPTPYRVLGFGLNYNTQRLTAAQAPKRWEDLLDPKWKRKFLMPNPALHASTLQFVLNLEKLLGPKWLSVVQSLARQRPRLTRDPGEEIPTLTSGEVPLAIGYIKDKFQFAGPIDFVKMDRYLVIVSYVAVSRKAPHPNAARLFTDFFLGPEPQQTIANLGDYVLHPEVEDRFRSEVTDEQLVPMRLPSAAERETWTKKFREMFR